ncbi:MAG: DUF2156 domain-containing protein [Deltaproteobacteria bacterium]|nr:DUF2156 domain-containing protein [Deltaproteobacteria bacterium]
MRSILFHPDFKPLVLEDQNKLEPFLAAHPQGLAGFTFAGLYAWAGVFGYEWLMPSPDLLLVSCRLPPHPERHLVQPVGVMSEAAEHELVEAARRLPYPLRIQGVGEAFVTRYPWFAAAFSIEEDRARADYIYRAEDLALLQGGAYARKRNHLAQARASRRWTTQPITAAVLSTCVEIAEAVRQEIGNPGNISFQNENAALAAALESFAALEQQGIIVYADLTPAAFAIFEPQAPDLAVIHFERAIRAVKGAHQVVNQESARALLAQGFKLINREDDLGLPGLRKAKLSYYPAHLTRSLVLTVKPPAPK